MYISSEAIEHLDNYLDKNVSPIYQRQPLAQDWARIAKIGEELGEAIDALIGETGQNPRKGYFGEPGDVNNELCDVIFTALLALQHRTKDIFKTEQIVANRLSYRLEKATIHG